MRSIAVVVLEGAGKGFVRAKGEGELKTTREQGRREPSRIYNISE